YLPREFVLGDPAARDAALHAIQACIPHHRILPTGIDRLVVEHAPDRRRGTPIRFVRARETQRNGNSFIYDVELADQHGQLIERWEGLHLRAVEGMAPREAWPEPLLAPYLERRLQELVVGSPITVAFERRAPTLGAPKPVEGRLPRCNAATDRV